MSMYEQFKTSQDLETSGIALDYGDFIITVARAGGANKKFSKTLERLMRPYQRAHETDTLAESIGQRILRAAYIEAIILKWETRRGEDFVDGIEAPDGGDLLPFTPENVGATLVALPDLFLDIQAQTRRAALFREADLESASGN